MEHDRFCHAIGFVLTTGIEVFPVQMKRRNTGNVAFRISAGGNTLAGSEEVTETEMLEKVMSRGYVVRCASLDRTVTGLYKIGERSVVKVNDYTAMQNNGSIPA